jgi:hypothetical protein
MTFGSSLKTTFKPQAPRRAKKLNWNPTGPTPLADLDQMRDHETDTVGASAVRRA